ncbi:MAG TPA: phage holin family protein [Rhodocyclaceae bacterium]|nr:phage holin family protein [Rhodocyclaceae bacterium]
MEAKHDPSGTETAIDSDNATPGALEETKILWHALRRVVRDHLQLAALETRLAGESLVTMIAAGVMVAALLVSTWLVLVAAAVLQLVNSGVSLSSAMLLAALANLVAALVLYGVIRRRSYYLAFPATLRSLSESSSKLTADMKMTYANASEGSS